MCMLKSSKVDIELKLKSSQNLSNIFWKSPEVAKASNIWYVSGIQSSPICISLKKNNQCFLYTQYCTLWCNKSSPLSIKITLRENNLSFLHINAHSLCTMPAGVLVMIGAFGKKIFHCYYNLIFSLIQNLYGKKILKKMRGTRGF